MGNPFGPPDKPHYQRDVLRAALELATADNPPGKIVDLRDTWSSDFTDKVTTSLLAM